MIPAPLDSNTWGTSSIASSSAAAEGAPAGDELSDDWLFCFDFTDLPPVPSTQVDLPELFDLDCTDSFHVSDLLPLHESLPSFDLSDESPAFMITSEGFSSVSVPGKADGGEHERQLQCTFTPFEASTPSLHNNSSAVSSPYNSDAGSSMAVAEGANFFKEGCANQGNGLESSVDFVKNSMTQSVASSRKRHHEDMCSDMDGGDAEGKSQLDPEDKKQQRLLRNRELAFESRQRKKCYVRDLEAKCKMLEQERNQLQQQVCFSAAENAVLKEELSRMKKMQGRGGVAEPAVLFENSLPLEFLSLLICLLLIAQLSPCGSPFLVLVVRAVMCPQSPIKAEGLLEKRADRKRCFHYIIDDIRWSFDHLWFYKSFRVHRLFMARLTWQVPLLSSAKSFCKSLKGAIT